MRHWLGAGGVGGRTSCGAGTPAGAGVLVEGMAGVAGVVAVGAGAGVAGAVVTGVGVAGAVAAGAGVAGAAVAGAGGTGVVVAGVAGAAGFAGFGWFLGFGGADEARVCALGIVSVAAAQPLRRWVPMRRRAVKGVITSPSRQASA